MAKAIRLTEKAIRDALSDIYDPEMHVDIVSLGLVYAIKVNEDNDVRIIITLTFPGCPWGGSILEEVENEVKKIKGVRNVVVDLTFDPPWSPEKIDPDVRAALGL